MRKLSIVLSILGVITFMLAACGGSETPSQPANTPVSEAPAAEENQAQPAPAAKEVAEATNTESQENAETGASEQPAEAPAAEEAAKEATEETAPAEEPVAEPQAAESETETAAVSDVRTFVIVPEQSRASYIVDEEFFGGAVDQLGIQPGLVDTIGSTQEVSGEMQLDFSNPADPLISNQFQVNLQSLTSDQSRRDNRIREANLESNRYPLALFTITSLENAPASFADGAEVTFQAAGDITIREVTQPATFDVTARLNGGTISGVATTQLKMSDFGFEPPNFANLFSVADEFTAQVEFTFQEQ